MKGLSSFPTVSMGSENKDPVVSVEPNWDQQQTHTHEEKQRLRPPLSADDSETAQAPTEWENTYSQPSLVILLCNGSLSLDEKHMNILF